MAKRRSRSAPSSALRRRILAEAVALFSARRERSAPADGGSQRRKESSRARPTPAKKRGSPSPALPLALAQAGTDAGGGNVCLSGAFAVLGVARARAKRRRDALAQVVGEGGGEVWVGANHLAMVHAPRRFVSSFPKLSAPLVVAWRCPISFQYQSFIEQRRSQSRYRHFILRRLPGNG
jgi:hypothetical protein